MKKILVIHTWGIGDFIMFIPALNNLKKKFPAAEIDLLINALPIGKLTHDTELINNLFTINVKKNSLLEKIKIAILLRKRKYDLSLFTDGVKPIKSSLFSLLVGARIKIGQYKKIPMPFFNKQIKFDRKKHRVERNNEMVGLVGASNNQIDIKLPIPDTNKTYAKKFVSNNLKESGIIIGVHPGCDKNNKQKRWGTKKWIDLIIKLKKTLNKPCFLIFGGPDEEDIVLAISEKTKSIAIIKESIQNTAALIEICHIFLNNDSGLGHMAAALNIPTFTIFGPANHNWTKPYNKRAVVIKKNLPCQPCNNKLKKCSKQITCLKKLSVEEVYDKIITSKIIQKNQTK